MMEERQKNNMNFYKERLNKDKWVIICFLVSIVIVICEHVDKLSFLKFVESVVFYLNEGTILYTLATSYISGVIVYFLTVVIPEIRKRKAMLVEICYLLKELEDEFTSLRLELGIEDWHSSDEAIENAIQMVKHYNKSNNDSYKLDFCIKILEKLAQDFDNLTSVILSYFSILNEDELDAIIKIKRSRNAYFIKYKDGIENVMNESTLRNYFKDLAQLHQNIIDLQEKIKNRIYKQ